MRVWHGQHRDFQAVQLCFDSDAFFSTNMEHLADCGFLT